MYEVFSRLSLALKRKMVQGNRMFCLGLRLRSKFLVCQTYCKITCGISVTSAYLAFGFLLSRYHNIKEKDAFQFTHSLVWSWPVEFYSRLEVLVTLQKDADTAFGYVAIFNGNSLKYRHTHQKLSLQLHITNLFKYKVPWLGVPFVHCLRESRLGGLCRQTP